MNKELKAALENWNRFSEVVRLSPPQNQEQFKKLLYQLKEIVHQIGYSKEYELIPLYDIISGLVKNYDNKHYKIDKPSCVDILQFLMVQHNLKQSDLIPDFGTQSVVSEVLSGTRKINLKQTKALAKRFGVGITNFIDND